jgi:hypothetical protein
MITENDIKVGNVLKYLGGHEDYDRDFTVGEFYTVERNVYHNPCIKDDRENFRIEYVFEILDSWEIVSTASTESIPNSPKQISLTLSPDEAQALADVLTLVDGHNGDSRVGYILDIQQLLATLGFKQSEIDDCSGSIYFEQTKEETVEYAGNTYNKAAFDAMLNTLEKL